MLTAIWLLPLAGGLIVMLLPHRFAKWLGSLVGLGALGLAVYAAYAFDPAAHGYQFVERSPWIQQLGVDYFLGLDGISVWLVILNALISLIAILATPVDMRGAGRFVGLLLVMEAGMAGVFLAVNLLLFYVFWEAMLIPAYFLLWIWGEGPRPLYAALKFVLFTLSGSLLMLVGVIGEYVFTGGRTLNLPDLAAHPLDPAVQFGLFFLFAIAFAIKIPAFPMHGWLPDAYVSAPVPFLVAFAGVMGKTGAYAMLRILIPLFHHPVLWWDWNQVMPVLGVLGIIWGALMALAQRDVKRLVAYSSVSHMGFIVLGIFSLNAIGQQGAVLQMVNHGVIIPALFLLVAWIEVRTGTRDRAALFGLAPRMPVLAGVFLLVTLAALGLPGLNSFVGEFMTLLGAWGLSPGLAIAAAIGLVLAPIYMLRLFQGSMYGERSAPAGLHDLRGRELALLTPLLALMFAIGLYPYFLTRVMTSLGVPLPWS